MLGRPFGDMPSMCRKPALLATVLTPILLLSVPALAADKQLRIGTLAPKNSLYHRQLMELAVSGTQFGRPFATNAAPTDRVAALRAAFDATMKDAEFLAEAKKLNIDVNPVSGKALDDLLAELYATPKDVVKKAGEAITK